MYKLSCESTGIVHYIDCVAFVVLPAGVFANVNPNQLRYYYVLSS